VGRVDPWVGSGRVGSGQVFGYFGGSGRVKKVVGRVGSGPDAWTHSHL